MILSKILTYSKSRIPGQVLGQGLGQELFAGILVKRSPLYEHVIQFVNLVLLTSEMVLLHEMAFKTCMRA